jgi:hypothetical protein
MYNTETAKVLGMGKSDCGQTDICWFEEHLYKKKTGEFFLAGKGGADSKYAIEVQINQYSGGRSIMPISEEQAKKWSERHLTVDEYVVIFGEPEE